MSQYTRILSKLIPQSISRPEIQWNCEDVWVVYAIFTYDEIPESPFYLLKIRPLYRSEMQASVSASAILSSDLKLDASHLSDLHRLLMESFVSHKEAIVSFLDNIKDHSTSRERCLLQVVERSTMEEHVRLVFQLHIPSMLLEVQKGLAPKELFHWLNVKAASQPKLVMDIEQTTRLMEEKPILSM